MSFKSIKIALLTSLVGFTALLLPSCSKDVSDKAEQLLESVPSTAAMVTTVNMPELLENAGCKVNGNEVKPSKKVASVVETNFDSKEVLKIITSGKSGVDVSAMVAFMDAGNMVVTGLVADTKEFRNFITTSRHQEFKDEDGVEVCGNVAFKGEQFWVFDRKVNTDKVLEWTRLSKNQSYASEDNIEDIIDCKNALNGRLDIMAVINQATVGKFSELASAQLALAAVFDNAQYLAYSVDFDKGTAQANAVVLNAKGRPASLNLPFQKIDDKDIVALGGSANGFFAININKKLTDQIAKNFSRMGGVKIPIENMIGALDGTCAFKFSDNKDIDGRLKIGDGDPEMLLNMLSEYGTARRQDNYIVLQGKQSMSGRVTAEMAAKALDGSYVGFIADPRSGITGTHGAYKEIPFSKLIVTLNPKGSGVEMNISLTALNPKEKFLEQILTAK